MVRYPHTYAITWQNSATKGPDGNYTSGSSQGLQGECRAEPDGKSQEIRGVDGNMVQVSFGVYLPKQTVTAPVGAMVEIKEGDKILFSGKLLRMVNRQTHSRLWL